MRSLRAAQRAAGVDTGSLYERTRLEFIATVVSLSAGQLCVRVPATPAWSVRDVLAHVVGLAADLNAQCFPATDDVGGTAWTSVQVELRIGRPLRELIAEWDSEAATFEDGLRAFGYEFGSHFVADLHAHYQDVRNAVGLAPACDELTLAVALDHYLGFVDEMLSAARWGTLDVVVGGERRQLGTAGPRHARVGAQPFELLRALSGRRSARQIRALDWQGDSEQFLSLLLTGFAGGYSLPAADILE